VRQSNKKRDLLIWTAVLIAGFAAAKILLPAEPAHADGEHHGIPNVVFYQALNFAGVLSLIYILMRDNVKAFFKTRSQSVTEKLQEAKRLHQEATGRLQEVKTKLRELEIEGQTLIKKMKEEGEAYRLQMEKETVRLVETIQTEAKRAAQNELDRSREVLYEEVLSQALEGARGLLDKSVAEKDQRRLQKEFVEKIEAVH
jgi:F0F1-type ATP synthase membrane subunit b/b'